MREKFTHTWGEQPAAKAPQQLQIAAIIFISLIALAALLGPSLAKAAVHAKVVIGPARIVDGDTIEIQGQRIRLEGIDTPERAQTCPRRWVGTWNCGQTATIALKKLIAGQTVRCVSKNRDRYDRLIATCFVGTYNINAHMVRTGNAWAFIKYSTTYKAEESVARSKKIGVWSGRTATAPWVYRASKWARARQSAPDGCAIKGNISGNGKIYHAPWSPWYDKVIIDKSHGERWFCSESEAKDAGWRAARAL